VKTRLRTTVLCVLALVGVAQLGLDVRMVPRWIYEARWKWHYYQERNNPPCQRREDCVSFATEHCPSPLYLVACYPHDQGVCRCGAGDHILYFTNSMSVPTLLEDLEYERQHADAGLVVSP